MNINYRAGLSYIADKIGDAPRNFTFGDYFKGMRVTAPSWNRKRDKIRKIIDNWYSVFNNGMLTWGQIIQCNTGMFEAGVINSPAEFLI